MSGRPDSSRYTQLRDRAQLAMKLRRRLAGGAGAVEALRRTWSRYPEEWSRDAALSKGAGTLGEEWGGAAFADLVVELTEPYLGAGTDVLELGCGGGKFSSRLAPRCGSLVCTDISSAMIEHARTTLAAQGIDANVSYRVLNGIDFTGVPDSSVDFIFSYDVQVHLQPENVYSYMVDARRVLRENGIFMLHQVNLASDGGVGHFLGQYYAGTWQCDLYDARRRGFMYFMSGDQMRTLAAAARLAVDRIVDDFPPAASPLRAVTDGRDLIGFLERRPSRLRDVDPATVRVVRGEGSPTVYALLDGSRVAFASRLQFGVAGFRDEDVEELPTAELEAMHEAEPLAPWE